MRSLVRLIFEKLTADCIYFLQYSLFAQQEKIQISGEDSTIKFSIRCWVEIFLCGASLMSNGTEYFKIPVTDFAEESSLPVDVYFESQPDKFQRLAQTGSFFSLRHIPFSTQKQLQWLFLKKEDYRQYVNFSVGQSGLELTPKFDVHTKLDLLNKKIDEKISHYLEQGISKSSLEIVQNTLQNILHLVIENPVTNKLFEKIELIESQHYHSLSVAIWSQILAERLGWSGEPTAFRVAFCALFHDVGFNDNVDALLQKDPTELNSQDVRILEGHVYRGRDILTSISGLPSEVITVAFQHHELVNGTGYPEKLFLDEIHPIARLISLTNRFYEIYFNSKLDSLIEAFHILKKDQIHFDLRFFKTLEDVLFRK